MNPTDSAVTDLIIFNLMISGILLAGAAVYLISQLAALRHLVAVLQGVRLGNVNLSGATLNLAMQIRNPSNVPVQFRGYIGNAIVNGVPVADIFSTQIVTIQPNNATIVTLPVLITYFGAGQLVRDIINSRIKSLNIQTNGIITTNFGRIPIKIAQNIPITA